MFKEIRANGAGAAIRLSLNNDKKCSIDTLAEYVYIEKIGAPLEVNIFKKMN